MTLVETFVGNRSPSLTDTITANNVAFNLTGSTVRFRMRAENSATLKVDQPATIVVAAAGTVQYDWAGNDVNTPGRYQAWWSVTLPSGLMQDSPEFPVLIQAHDGAASQVTIDTIRDHVETGINDEALGLLLDDAVGEVEGRFGTDSQRTERYFGGGEFIRLQRPALSIASIAELNEQRYPLYTLVSTDYDLLNNGRTIQRLTRNTVWYWRYWASIVDVTYTPIPEQTVRDRVTIDLVKLAVQYNALQQEQVGGRTGYMSLSQDYLKERERLLGAIPASRGFRFT